MLVTTLFTLYRNDLQKHLCPWRAYLRWIRCRGTENGKLFVPFLPRSSSQYKFDGFLSYISFQKIFKRDLEAVGIHGFYNPHSLRIGGCQFFATERKKNFSEIVDWGGWAEEDRKVIYRYLTKNKNIKRFDFTRP